MVPFVRKFLLRQFKDEKCCKRLQKGKPDDLSSATARLQSELRLKGFTEVLFGHRTLENKSLGNLRCSRDLCAWLFVGAKKYITLGSFALNSGISDNYLKVVSLTEGLLQNWQADRLTGLKCRKKKGHLTALP